MNKTRVIEKDEDTIYSIFANAKIEEKTVAAGYNFEAKRWSVKHLAVWAKWIPSFAPKEYNESIEVPPEIIEEMKRKQKEFDVMFQTEGS